MHIPSLQAFLVYITIAVALPTSYETQKKRAQTFPVYQAIAEPTRQVDYSTPGQAPLDLPRPFNQTVAFNNFTIAAIPQADDRGFSSPVTIEGQTFYLAFDTGSTNT